MKLFNHNQLKKQQEASEHLMPLIVSNDGYVLTNDERIAFRMALGQRPVRLWRSESKDLGLDHQGITPQEAYALMSRFQQMEDIEDAALKLQSIASRMRNLLVKAKSEVTSNKLKVEISRILLETEKYE